MKSKDFFEKFTKKSRWKFKELCREISQQIETRWKNERSDTKMVSAERIVNADYRDSEELVPFRGNPLIAALPEPKDSKLILKSLSFLPEYTVSDRNLSVPDRLLACEQIMHFYEV
jgi:hypothetical protein